MGNSIRTCENAMTSTRIPSEAELIELENWAIKFGERIDRAMEDEEEMDTDRWNVKYPDLPYYASERTRLYENIRALLDLARTVKNPGK